MKKHRVLITGIGGNIGQGVLKSLRAGKRQYYTVGIDMEGLSAGFYFTDSYYITPRTGSAGFRKELEKIVRREKIEAIYVCSPTELEFFSENKEDLEKELAVSVFVNPINVVRIGSDKLQTSLFLKNASLPYLESSDINDTEGVDSIIKKYGFPLIAKPRCGFSSKNVFIVKSMEELEAARKLIPDIIIQRYIPGDDCEYTATTISDKDKKVLASIVLHRDLIQGTTYRTELNTESAISNQVKDIVNKLGAVGVCNLQFRVMDGTVYVFEINPRFSGTGGIRYLYGFNDAEMVFELLRLGKAIRQPKLKQAVILRYWNEIFIPEATFKDIRELRKIYKGKQTVL